MAAVIKPREFPGVCCMRASCADQDCPGAHIARLYEAEGGQQVDCGAATVIRPRTFRPTFGLAGPFRRARRTWLPREISVPVLAGLAAGGLAYALLVYLANTL